MAYSVSDGPTEQLIQWTNHLIDQLAVSRPRDVSAISSGLHALMRSRGFDVLPPELQQKLTRVHDWFYSSSIDASERRKFQMVVGIQIEARVRDIDNVASSIKRLSAERIYVDQYTTDRKKIIAAMKQDGLDLQKLSPEMQDDFEVVMEAVKQNGCALRYATPRLRKNMAICCAAIASRRIAKEWVDPTLWNEPVFCAAVRMIERQIPSPAPTFIWGDDATDVDMT